MDFKNSASQYTQALCKVATAVVMSSMLSFTANAQYEDYEDYDNSDLVIQATCITREDQLHTAPRIEAVVNKVGGMRNLEGRWRLGGMEGSFKRVIVNIASEAVGLKALIEGLDNVTPAWGALTVCETNKSDVVHVAVYGEEDSLFVRGVSRSAIQIAQISGGKAGSFYTFNKQ